MDGILTLSSKNQLTLPVTVVSKLGLKRGTKFWTKVVGKTFVIEKIEDTWEDLHGFLADNPIAKKYTYDQVYKNETEAGYITFVHRPDIKTGVLYEVFVLPEFRCTGIGARLVAYTENLSRCAGYSRVRLSVCAFDLVTEASVTEAWLKTWYQKLGYTIASDGTGEYEKRLVST